MKKAILATLILLLASTAANADTKHWYKNPKWWAGEAVIVTALVLDGQSTCRNFSHGYVEGSLILHGSHSCGAAIGVLAAGAGIYTGLHAILGHVGETEPSPKWRALGYLEVPAVVAGFHGYAAIHNYSQPIGGR